MTLASRSAPVALSAFRAAMITTSPPFMSLVPVPYAFCRRDDTALH
jgi:hypothetical protein